MTTKEMLHELVNEIPDELADDALRALQRVYPLQRRRRAGFIGIASFDEPTLGRRAKEVIREEIGRHE